MSELTKAEKKWIKDVQKVLDKCPSKRIGFYTIGDNNIGLYNKDYQEEIEAGDYDLVRALNKTGYGFDETLDFPDAVQGVCG